jgi:hypothetical protein
VDNKLKGLRAGSTELTATADIAGETVTKTIQVTVDQASLQSAVIQMDTKDYDYTGEEVVPTGVTVTLGDITLDSETDYDLSYKDNVNTGTATITVTGKGNYTGSTKANYYITKPSAVATQKPTAAPTVEPTQEPAIVYTQEPAIVYTQEPATVYTTEPDPWQPETEPTIEPTGEPGIESTMEPGSWQPTTAPTMAPTTTTPKPTATAKATTPTTQPRTTSTPRPSATSTVAPGTGSVSLPRGVIKKATVQKGGKVVLKLGKKAANVSGYRILYSTDKRFPSSNTKYGYVTGTKFTIKGLKKGKRYYIKVRACNKTGTEWTYGKWSKTVKVKAK